MQAYNEAGVAFEPFHLRKERQEGFFDAEGNYIQYRLEEVKDAWLDSLKPGMSSLYVLDIRALVRPVHHTRNSRPGRQLSTGNSM